jgi:hypothetical protein
LLDCSRTLGADLPKKAEKAKIREKAAHDVLSVHKNPSMEFLVAESGGLCQPLFCSLNDPFLTGVIFLPLY